MSRGDKTGSTSVKPAANLSEEEIQNLIGKAAPTLVATASNKTAFSATADDFVAPVFTENKDYKIEALNPVFVANALSDASTLQASEKEALKTKMLNGINQIKYTIKVTSKTNSNDSKTIEKTFDVQGFISKAKADEIFKALEIKAKENVDKSAVKITPASAKNKTKTYKFLHGTYDEKTLKSLDLLEITAPKDSAAIKVENKFISSNISDHSAILQPKLYLDEASKEYIFAYKDKTNVESEATKVTINGLPIPALSASAIAKFYGNKAEKPYSVDEAKTVEKLGKALDQVLPSEIKVEQIVLKGNEITLTGSDKDDQFTITADMLKAMNGRVTEVYPIDQQGILSITIKFDTVIQPNAVYMLESSDNQTTDEKVAAQQVGTIKISLKGLKQNQPEPKPQPDQPAPNVEVKQGTAFVLGEAATFENVSNKVKEKHPKNLFQFYKDLKGYGIASNGKGKDNEILLFAEGMGKDNINFGKIQKSKKYYLDGTLDEEHKTLTVKYQQKINGKFEDVVQVFTLK
ncbi:hypothetical protein [Mycoplasma sp. 2634B]|uniref:hypothetical protein n=3 Tax=Mycoplasma TaxID=2093 RepID=UPI003AAC1AA2